MFNRVQMQGKNVLITGCNSGIGLQTALELAKRGATINMACRNSRKMKEATSFIKEKVPNSSINCYILDLSSFESVRKCAQNVILKEKKIDVLINNAGLMMHPFQLTEDNIEMHVSKQWCRQILMLL